MHTSVVAAEAADDIARRMLGSVTPPVNTETTGSYKTHPLYDEVRKAAHSCSQVLTEVRQHKTDFERELTTKLPAPEQAICPLAP